MIRHLMQKRPDAPWAQVFFGASLTFMGGTVAYILNPVLGLLVWAFLAVTLVRRVRFGVDSRRERAAHAATQAEWDARWARWGGRP